MTAWDSDWRIAQNFFWVIRRLGIFPAHAKFMTFRLFFLFAFTVYVESVFAVEKPLPRSTPEAQGVSSSAICAFVEAANTSIKTLHSFMMVRHGKVIAEGWWKPESAEKPHVLWSLSKSFAATAVGLAVADGKLGLDDPVLKFFPECAPPEPSEHLKAMRVRHLLSMSGGHETEPKFSIEKGPSVREFLAHPVTHAPGTWFRYNTPSTYMCSAIVSKVTGLTVLEFLKPRLFEPLGIESPRWDVSAEGYSLGGYGLYARTEDIAKFGQLYLQRGRWEGKQLIPESWVDAATSKQVDNDRAPSGKNPEWRQGYGFQFWRCRNNAYRGDGRDGQICLVMPDQDVVIAITAQTSQMQGELDLVWEKLLPALGSGSLPENQTDQKRLTDLMTALRLPPPAAK
jgi:CubicO group peptidase (beta-lactamase class C family)